MIEGLVTSTTAKLRQQAESARGGRAEQRDAMLKAMLVTGAIAREFVCDPAHADVAI